MDVCSVAAVKLVTAACLIAGDSIGVGLHSAMPECAVDAKNCIGSAAIVSRVHAGYAVVIVSAGSNDPGNSHLIENLLAMRRKAPASRFIWIAPVSARAADAVRRAALHSDAVVTFTPARDHVHPASDAALARAVRAKMKGE